jgi:ribulose-5-phosphate 4-epimerase/fuculose-1-phosphate aldolase
MIEPESRQLIGTLEHAWRRLTRQGLIASTPASMSLRLPGSTRMLVCGGADGRVDTCDWSERALEESSSLALPAAIYRIRGDVGAIALGGGSFARALAGFGGTLPGVFDEQARHLGGMPEPVTAAEGGRLRAALGGGGNALLVAGMPVCLGTTCQRLILNAELFEKCAKAWVLAIAAGGQPRALPWWVRRIANGRLRRDERRAARSFANGQLPEETNRY